MYIDRDVFRAYDIRGVVDRQLNEAVVEVIAKALAVRYPKVKLVAVGRDGRLSSERLANALCRGLCASGVEVMDIGEVPTPLLYYAAFAHCNGSGLMITGSHNPMEYNGIKMMMDTHTLAGDEVLGIYDTIQKADFINASAERTYVDRNAEYIERVKSDVVLAKPLKLAIDCGNGVAGPIALALFEALGCETTGLYCDVNGLFPNHHPNPSVVENLRELIDTVKRGDFDLGLAFDGDGDRLGVIDNRGEIVWADKQMMIYARALLEKNKGAGIVYDVKSSSHLPRLIEQYGGKPYICRTGHSYIKTKLKETGALLAGEMSGHIFFNDRWYGFDDALYAAARLLEIVAKDGRASSQIFGELPVSFSTPEITVWFEDEGKQHEFIEQFVEQAHFENAKIDTTDGVRADFAHGWGLVRASNTTPCLVLRFEGDSEQDLKKVQSEFRTQICNVDPNLSLPF